MTNTFIKIINSKGGDFAFFTETKDLYARLSGVKDPHGDYFEFIEIGQTIILNDDKLKVKNINLKFSDVDVNTNHSDKSEKSMPANFTIEVIITVKYLGKI